jgi:hypothetical protein
MFNELSTTEYRKVRDRTRRLLRLSVRENFQMYLISATRNFAPFFHPSTEVKLFASNLICL